MIFLSAVSSGNERALALIDHWASDADRVQAMSYRAEKRRHDFLLARSSLRALLAEVTGTADWALRPDARGKPYAFAADGRPGPFVSLSHTQGAVACAVSRDSPVGIDLEFWRARDFVSIADYVFGPGERRQVGEEGITAFYRLWTAREALAKMKGTGLLAEIDGEDCAADMQLARWSAMRGAQLLCLASSPLFSLTVAAEKAAAVANTEHVLAELNAIGQAIPSHR